MKIFEKNDFLFYILENFAGGLNLKADPIMEGSEFAIEAINCDFRDGKSIQSRDGYARWISNTFSKNIYGIYPFYVGATLHKLILTWDGSAYVIYDSTTSKQTGNASSVYFIPATYNDLCYIPHRGNDDSEDYNLKYDGTTMTKCGIDAPTSQCACAATGAAAALYVVRETIGYLYKFDSTNSELDLLADNVPVPIYFMDAVVLSNVIYACDDAGKLWKYDGSAEWEVVAPQLGSEYVRCLCVFGGEIYGGTFGLGKLYKWNGSDAWAQVAGQSGSETAILSLCVHDDGSGDDLYGGTYPSGKLLRYNSGTASWDSVASQLNSQTHIYALCVYNDGGGNRLYGSTGQDILSTGGRLFQWNNSDAWVQKADTLGSASVIYSLCTFNDGGGTDLYGGTNIGNLLRWNDSNAWVEAAPVLSEIRIYKLIVSTNLYGCTGLNGEIYKYNTSTSQWENQTSNGNASGKLIAIVSATIGGNLDGTYYYYYSYYNSSTGAESALSPISFSVAPSDQAVALTSLADSDDTQVDKKRIYRTGGTLSTINFIAEIDSSSTSYTDNTGDSGVGNAEDCSDNDVLAAVGGFSIHHHQLFGWGNSTYPGYVYDSRFYLPEAFPDTYLYKCGNATDTVVVCMPLDIDEIVYTKWHTYRLRYIGANEGSIVLEEIAQVGLASDNTLVLATTAEGKPYHIFLGQSARGRGIYINDGNRIMPISGPIDPIFTGERSAGDPIANIEAINWSSVDTACAAFGKNKYYLAYPSGSDTKPANVIIIDMNFNPPSIHKMTLGSSSDTINAIVYNAITDEIVFGGDVKEVYYLTGTTDWVSGAAAGIAMTYQTAYFGDRNIYGQLKSIVFNANTQGQTLSVKIYVDFSLKSTLTTSSSSMTRIALPCPSTCQGRLFSIRFEVSTPTTANKRIKISPPLELKIVPLRRY